MNYKAAAMVGTASSSNNQSTTSENPSRVNQPRELFVPSNPMTEGSSQVPQITNHRLNGANYLTWAQSVKLAVNGKGKLGFLTGLVETPAVDDPRFSQWSSENSMVISWLINSMDPEIGKTYMFLPKASDIWEAVRDTYSDLENYSQLFELNSKIWKMQQGSRSVTSYYNEMMALWQELDLFETEAWNCSGDAVMFRKQVERSRVFVFLAGLNRDLDTVRGRVLGIKPFPSLKEVFAEVRREEGRRKVMLGETEAPESSALISQAGNQEEKKGKGRPWCVHCKKLGHLRDDCWKLHGKPAHIGKRKTGSYRDGETQAYQVSSTDQGQQSTPDQLASMKEQLDHLYKLFNQQLTPFPSSSNSSVNLA